MSNYKAQPCVVGGESLVRRRFYLSEDVWMMLSESAEDLDTTPSILVDEVLAIHFNIPRTSIV